ncbi:MAG TPA: DegT/DnrJ/EryC1/StrS family aminotransferase [Treponemataceae bacterium]|nr:DegT/DnrJ/EryC1/StrS family aminotransferase [Treponemataceae bacterium]
MSENKIFVTSPLLPELHDFIPLLETIWESKWLTNHGFYHQKLERALEKHLSVAKISLFTNGTIPLVTAIQAMNLKGEIITSPFSFVATSHAILLSGLKPVFVDIDSITGNLDPTQIENAITKNTSAIMPVHVYGNPCDTKAIKKIADKYDLKIIYDAAHAFGVKVEGKSILREGDLSTLSFHATKVYNTIEGGALVSHDDETKKKIDSLKNFGIIDEITVESIGTNGKLDEIRSAFGLLTLEKVDGAIQKRKKIVEKYRSILDAISGIRYISDMPGVEHNYAYFPVFIDKAVFGKSRDELYFALQKKGIHGRRYFYPLITSFPMYKNLPSAHKDNLPVAYRLAEEVLCLPIYADLSLDEVERIVSAIKDIQNS